MTEEGFRRLVTYLQGVFGETFTEERRDAYYLTLLNDDDRDVFVAAVAYCRSERARYGVPKPGDLLVRPGQEGAAVLAWATLLRAVETWGAMESVRFEDRVLSAVVEALGGWARVCEMPLWDPRESRFLQRDFERLYGSLAARGAVGPERHIGAAEAHNIVSWPDKVPPLRVVGAVPARAVPALTP